MNWTPYKMANLALISIATLAVTSIALGQDTGTADPGTTGPGSGHRELRNPGHRLLLHRADADHDGVVTREEWQALSTEISGAFESLDTDNDGAVTLGQHGRRERIGRRGPRGPSHGPRAGATREQRGRIAGGMMFHAADQAGDADGNLDRNEWTNFLADTDTNGDGSLQGEEVRQGLRSLRDDTREPPAPSIDELAGRFDQLDADGNGVISSEELPRAGRHRVLRDQP